MGPALGSRGRSGPENNLITGLAPEPEVELKFASAHVMMMRWPETKPFKEGRNWDSLLEFKKKPLRWSWLYPQPLLLLSLSHSIPIFWFTEKSTQYICIFILYLNPLKKIHEEKQWTALSEDLNRQWHLHKVVWEWAKILHQYPRRHGCPEFIWFVKTLGVLSSLGVSTSSWEFRAFPTQSCFFCERLGLVGPPTGTQISRSKGESGLKSLLLLLTCLRWERWRSF